MKITVKSSSNLKLLCAVAMTKVTLRQVVGAVAQVRGRRGARLRDIVDCVVEQVHWRAVGRTLQSLVSSGTLQRRGKRFRLAPRHRTSPQFATRKRRGIIDSNSCREGN